MSHDSVETICHSIVYLYYTETLRAHAEDLRSTFLVETTFTVSLRASIVSRVVALSIAYETRRIITG
ncbi:hypothetical protein DTO207G8_7522 [Paecilomyces variotii]|nr:hypothetical protein DTO207G8_7522 [Paecilomyces variotii]KAJ9378041.1 hypothetical protein DTO063F5_7928 [Paecilomyces variotii]